LSYYGILGLLIDAFGAVFNLFQDDLIVCYHSIAFANADDFLGAR
jgi:hypothetical protein